MGIIVEAFKVIGLTCAAELKLLNSLLNNFVIQHIVVDEILTASYRRHLRYSFSNENYKFFVKNLTDSIVSQTTDKTVLVEAINAADVVLRWIYLYT